MSELHPDDKAKLGRVLGMKPTEIIAAVELPDADPPAAIVQTHDLQCVLVTTDQDGRPVVSPWDGPLPGADSEAVLVGESGPELVFAGDGGAVVVPDPNKQGDDQVPTGTAEEILTWVDTDADRAARALVVEQDSDRPRSTLVAALKKLAEPA